jgi:hypothetical protein
MPHFPPFLPSFLPFPLAAGGKRPLPRFIHKLLLLLTGAALCLLFAALHDAHWGPQHAFSVCVALTQCTGNLRLQQGVKAINNDTPLPPRRWQGRKEGAADTSLFKRRWRLV